MSKKRPYVIYPPGWLAGGTARTYATLESAKQAALKIANKSGKEIKVYLRTGSDKLSTTQVLVVKPMKSNQLAPESREDMRHETQFDDERTA